MTDDADEFPFVVHIPDAMLRRVDPTNVVLVAYLKNIDPTVQTGILLPREDKKSKCSNKNEPGSSEKLVSETTSKKSLKKKPTEVKVVNEVSVDVTIPLEPTIEDTQEKVVIPSKTSVFRKIKMKSKHTHKSPTLNVVRKPHLTHQCVVFCEIPAPVSPSSKKQMAEDMAKQFSQREKKNTQKLIITTESTEDEGERILETPEANLHKESSTPEQTMVIPPEDSSAKSSHEEARTSDINENLSHTDVNVNMGEGDVKTEAQGNPDTIVSLPPQIRPITSTTDSPTFKNIINQTFTSIFYSQSTDPPKTNSPSKDSIFMEMDTDNEGFGGTFEELEFDDAEQDFPDHMLMTMKQFKILNTKLNSIL
ncbi:unnamed protein product [Lactuca saligna]|uniref:Uncharacterized protein n=1 Tax=Lactuca saligna TaxID=75948 RepID=A0AA35YFE7_LACSI|nr:unnamed protein product [Lactuca saligna]